MSDPKHPAKIVIVIRGGNIEAVFSDKAVNARLFFADYDFVDAQEVDWRGKPRVVTEDGIMLDTAAVRNILNKKGKAT